MIGRAFLSHSSLNKPLVEEVANLLGRDKCVLDAYNFESGVGFMDSIEKHLDSCQIFVLFASREAFQSDWVKKEIERAEILRRQSRFITYIIDDGLHLSDLPNWLKDFKVYTSNLGAYAIFLDIDHAIRSLNDGFGDEVFIGRGNEIREFERARYDIDPKRVFLFIGLSGIGRRSLIRNISRSRLSVKKFATIHFKLGEDLKTLLLRLEEIYKSKAALVSLLVEVEKYTKEELISMIIDSIHELINVNHIIPIFLDDGGMIDHSGYLHEDFGLLFDAINDSSKQPYFFAALNRLPNRHSVGSQSMARIRVSELDNEDSLSLVNARMQIEEVSASRESRLEIVKFTNGHPDIIKLTIKDFKASGAISQGMKERLVAYYADFLSRYLTNEKDLVLTRPLIEYGYLPLAILQKFTKLPPMELESRVESLGDLSIVRRQDKWLSFSTSLLPSAKRIFAPLSIDEKRLLSKILFDYVKNEEDELFSTHLLEVFYESSIYSDSGKYPNSFPIFRTSVYTLISSFYRSRKYNKVVETYSMMSDRLPDMRDDFEMNYFYIASQINTYSFDDAKISLQRLKLGSKERSFLTGIMLRKQGEWSDALESFKQAERQGYRGPAIMSEMARCSLMRGDIEDASVYVERFSERSVGREDSYFLDIAIQIHYRLGNYEEMDRLLERLNIIDEQAYLFRRSYIEFQEENYDDAYTFIKSCIDSEKKNLPEYNMLSLMIRCCLIIGRSLDSSTRIPLLKEAEESIEKILSIVKNPSYVIRRYQVALLALRGEYENARRLAERYKRDKDYYNQNLLYIFEMQLSEARITHPERRVIEDNIALIKSTKADHNTGIEHIRDKVFTGFLR